MSFNKNKKIHIVLAENIIPLPQVILKFKKLEQLLNY